MVCELYLNKDVILRRKREKELKTSHGDGRVLTSFMENPKHTPMESKSHSNPTAHPLVLMALKKIANHVFNQSSTTPRYFAFVFVVFYTTAECCHY